jgi:sugar lactone lactonase YvrE
LSLKTSLLPLALILTGCAVATPPDSEIGWTAADAVFFPADRYLTHAEDGIALPDGRLIVGDFEHGLIILSPEGSKRPFGNFAAAGFEHAPSADRGGPNGVSLEPDGQHILVADIFTGAIYRADLASEAVVKVYDHLYGVNAAVRDRSGAIWFTQSTENPAGADAEERMFAAAVRPIDDGALFRIAPTSSGTIGEQAELMVGGINFANGLAVDHDRGEIYVSELMSNRILGFRFELSTGALSDRRTVAEVTTPDNIELDEQGRLWAASPLGNEILLVDPDSGAVRSVFQPTPEKSIEIVKEMNRRLQTGESVLELIGPDTFGPMPGLLTGIIISPDGGPVYVSGLGDALVRLDR